MNIRKKIKDEIEFYRYMTSFDDDDLSDGARQAFLEEGGISYFKNVLNIEITDGFECFIYYCELCEKQQNLESEK